MPCFASPRFASVENEEFSIEAATEDLRVHILEDLSRAVLAWPTCVGNLDLRVGALRPCDLGRNRFAALGHEEYSIEAAIAERQAKEIENLLRGGA